MIKKKKKGREIERNDRIIMLCMSIYSRKEQTLKGKEGNEKEKERKKDSKQSSNPPSTPERAYGQSFKLKQKRVRKARRA
jgi:hypothetical protein